MCAVSTVPDCVKFMQTLQITSPAKTFFTSLRRYPNMRSEVEVSMKSLRAALGSVYIAAHGVTERVVKLKVSMCLSQYPGGNTLPPGGQPCLITKHIHPLLHSK